MGKGIFVIQDDGTLVKMEEWDYDTEGLLQELLARYPDLLPGDQISPGSPRRWLFISREIGIPREEGGGDRWSLDHLFLDQDGVPTLVEVKRSTDTRIRREVIGQMLDYAANAIVYWPVETIRAQFAARCEADGNVPEEALVGFLDTALSEDDFWQRVNDNLQTGKIRMLFVADKIPLELRRVVEFLNEQMARAEVLAVEIPQFVGQGLRTLVPQVHGLTAGAEIKKGSRPSVPWNEKSFFACMEERCGGDIVRVARQIYEWSRRNVTRVWWGKGSVLGGFVSILSHNGRDQQLFELWTSGQMEIMFYWLANKPPFDSEEKRRDLLARFNAIPGVALPEDSIFRRPTIGLDVLLQPEALSKLFKILDWLVAEIKAV